MHENRAVRCNQRNISALHQIGQHRSKARLDDMTTDTPNDRLPFYLCFPDFFSNASQRIRSEYSRKFSEELTQGVFS